MTDPTTPAAVLATELEKGAEIIVPKTGIQAKLAEAAKANRPLRIKLGLDPTSPDLHLGHAVVLKKIRQFQDAGHEVHIVVGDFTALIGDPSGRNITRPALTRAEIDANAETYIAQVGKIIDVSKAKIHRNSTWLGKLSFEDIIKLLSGVTLAQILERNDFTTRYKGGTPIAMHELLYPVMQAYDSAMIDSDIELGGTDQLFNCMLGSDIQQALAREIKQIVVCMPLLRGTDGVDKMSKSKKNYIGLFESAEDMYFKVMSLPDELIPEYIRLTTDFPADKQAELLASYEDGKENPMLIKKQIAHNIATQYHDAGAADKAAEKFVQQVQSRDSETKEYRKVNFPTTPGVMTVTDGTIVDLVVWLIGTVFYENISKTEARRLITTGAFKKLDEKITDPTMKATDFLDGPSTKVQIGKKYYFEIIS